MSVVFNVLHLVFDFFRVFLALFLPQLSVNNTGMSARVDVLFEVGQARMSKMKTQYQGLSGHLSPDSGDKDSSTEKYKMNGHEQEKWSGKTAL